MTAPLLSVVRWLRHPLLLWPALFLFAVTLLSGCGIPPSPTLTPTLTPTATPTSTPTPTVTPTATPVPTSSPIPTHLPPTATLTAQAPQGELRVAALTAPPHLDVHQSPSEALAALGPGLAYSRLVRLVSGPDVALPSMRVECDLCQSWRLTDPLTCEFLLRPNARWHNAPPVNGRPVTAEDVVFSYQRMGSGEAPNAGLLAGIQSVSAVDRQTVRVHLRAPDADLLRRLADGHAKVAAAEVVSLRGDLKTGPVVGSGPWVWQADADSQSSVFRANTSYYEPGLPRVEQLSLRVIPDPATRLATLLAGRMDVARVSPEQWPVLAAKGFQSVQAPRMGTGVVVGLNVARPPFDSPQLRKAFLLAHDPWSLLKDVWADEGLVGVGLPVSEPDWLLTREELAPFFARPEEAQQIVRRVSPNRVVDVTLTVANYGEPYGLFGDLLARQMSQVGFSVTVHTLSVGEYVNQVWNRREFQVFVGALPPVSTTNGFLFSFLHSGGQWNVTGRSPGPLDALIEAQAAETEDGLRGGLVRQVQQRVLEEGLLYMPHIAVERWAYAPHVRGFHPNLAGSEYLYWALVEVQSR